MTSSSITQEPITILDLISLPFIPNSCSPSSLYKKPKTPTISCTLKNNPSSKLQSLCNEFNRFIRTHCERSPIGFGFASVRVPGEETRTGEGGPNGVVEDDGGVVNGLGSERAKKVLILMSDTGGGHRASAEAIKAAFNQEFGDEYQVNFIPFIVFLR